MAGVPGSEFHGWTFLQRRMFLDLMSPEEREYLGYQALHALQLAEEGREVTWYCADAGHPLPAGVSRPPVGDYRRIPVDAYTRCALARSAGAQRGSVVPVQCPRCPARGEIHWHGESPRFIGLHIDHIRPVSRGGSNDIENLRLLCPRCNISRGNREVA